MVQATRAGAPARRLPRSKPGDLDALTDALVDPGLLACYLSDIIDAIDINPFVVCERGHGAFGLNGPLVLRPSATA